MSSDYPLQMLLSLRIRRVDEASGNLSRLKQKLNLELARLASLQEELVSYHAWRLEETERRYTKIYETVQSQKEMGLFNQSIVALNVKEDDIRLSIANQEQLIAELKTDINKAQELLAKAHKALEKIKKHKEIYLEQLKKEIEYKEDLELEDFRVKSFVDI